VDARWHESEVKEQGSGVGSRGSGVGGQETGVGSQRSEVRGRRSEVGKRGARGSDSPTPVSPPGRRPLRAGGRLPSPVSRLPGSRGQGSGVESRQERCPRVRFSAPRLPSPPAWMPTGRKAERRPLRAGGRRPTPDSLPGRRPTPEAPSSPQ
jgi:hypothetical protein